jgi:hypothetical protein
MTNNNELESNAIQAASKAYEDKSFEVPKELVLSNGIILGIKNIPPLLINSVSNSIPEPDMPVTYIEEKDRDEPNPNHPAYIKAMEKRDAELNLATINLILYAGTELKHLPKGIPGPDEDDWVLLAEMAGIHFDPTNKIQRYLAWLRSYALATLKDLEQAQTLPLMLAGVTEVEVAKIENSFRGGEERGTDSSNPITLGSENGNNVQKPNRRTRRTNRGT